MTGDSDRSVARPDGNREGTSSSETRSKLGRRRRGGLRSLRERRRAGQPITLNLTPMIDTVFNLLFLFMIMSRFGPLEGLLSAKLPERAAVAQTAGIEIPRTPIRLQFVTTAAAPDKCSVTIERFNEWPMPLADLEGALRRIQQQPGFDANTPVHLMAGDNVRWDHVVNAYNAALAARYEKVYFAAPR